MAKDETIIKLPEKDAQIGLAEFKKEAVEKFKNIDILMYSVVIALIIISISSLISVGAIVIDQLHFNNEIYRENLLNSQKCSD